ncbi:hypothetical protein C8R43DRAFT_18469 [Mycena crocata]|nr:hypothetical protein C8R43DRAFT_18469 [Mycena crocata]
MCYSSPRPPLKQLSLDETNPARVSSKSILPADLEREIFEIVAHSWPLLIPRLLLVAWRVKLWLEPLIYRTLVLSRFKSRIREYPSSGLDRWNIMQVIDSRPVSLFRDSVHNLFMSMFPNEDEAAILSACARVENLWISSSSDPADLLGRIGDLPLKRLYCFIASIVGDPRIDFTHRVFSQITHLQLFDTRLHQVDGISAGLATMPQLTHLSFDHAYVPLWCILLSTCASLRVLIALCSKSALDDADPDMQQLAQDPRFVFMACPEYVADWQTGALTGVDFWSRAESFIEKRRLGEVASHQYHMFGDAQ